MSSRSAQPALKERNADDLLDEFSRAGGEEAFGEVVRRYAGMVFAVCLRVAGNAHDAEDATQATFLNLAVQLKSGKTVHRLGPWLQQVARRAALDVRRSRKRREAHEQKHGQSRAHEIESLLRDQGRNGHAAPGTNGNGHAGAGLPGSGDIDLEKLNAVLGEELGRLPPKYRLPLMSLYFGRMERDEIAKELGLTVGTLGVRIHRGRQMLARRLSERGVAPAARLLSGNVLALAISTVARANLSEQTAAAAAKLALGHDLAATTAAHVLAAIKGTAAAAILAKLKSVAVVAILVVASAAMTAVAGAAARWDVVESRLPDSVKRVIDFARSPWRLPLPKMTGPSVPSVVALASEPSPLPSSDPSNSWGNPTAVPALRNAPRVPPTRGVAPSGASVRSTAPAPAGGPARAGVNPSQTAAPVAPATRMIPPPPVATQLIPGVPPLARAAALPAPRPRPDDAAGPVTDLPGLQLGTGPGLRASAHVARGAVVVHPPALGGGPSVDVGGGGRLRLGGNRASATVVQPVTSSALPWAPPPPGGFPASLAIRGDAHSAGNVTGSGGSIGNGGALLNDGRVVADGGGQYRALIFAGYNSVQNTFDNPAGGNRGWFARNGGRLILPKIAVSPGTHTYTWGESSDDPTLDLINSVRVTLNEAKAPGKLDISLLDKSRPDVPALPAGNTFIGIWSFDAGVTGASGVDLTVRYDDRLAAQLGLNEGFLKLWRYDGAQWVRINDGSFFRDTQNNLLSGHADALSFFAVSTPEPSSLCLVLFGGLAFLRRGPRKI